MPRIDLERTLAAPIGACFEILADHEAYTRFGGISSARLLREGSPERNGLGAIRRLASGRIWFDEEITAYEPPNRLDYLILNTNLPLEHDGGSIRLEDRGGETHAHWVSAFRATGKLAPLAGPVLAATLRRGFIRMLDDAAHLARS